MRQFQYHLNNEYLLITNQKMASTFLSKYFYDIYQKNGLPHFSINDEMDIWSDSESDTDSLTKIFNGEIDKKIIIITREPLERYISALTQDVWQPIHIYSKSQHYILYLQNIIKKYLPEELDTFSNDINNFLQYKEIEDLLFDHEIGPMGQIREAIIKRLLRALLYKHFNNNTSFWGGHRKLYDSIIHILISNINKQKKFLWKIPNIQVFNLTEYSRGETLVEFMNYHYKKNYRFSNRKDNDNSIINKWTYEILNGEFKENLSRIKESLLIEIISYKSLCKYGHNPEGLL